VSAARIGKPVEEAEVHEQEPPRPLTREQPPAERFPTEALGEILGGAVQAIVNIIQVPEALAGQSVLAAATLAVQSHADIRLPTGQRKPISSFFVTIASSGDRKTSSDLEAMRAVQEREDELLAEYEAKQAQYALERESWDIERKKIMSIKNRADRDEALSGLGPAPEAPLHPILSCPEPTIEGLYRTLSQGQPSMGLFSDEGGQFIAGHGMNQENRLKSAAALSSLWDGTPIKRVRVSDGVMILPGRRLALHLMAQPEAAIRWLGDDVLLDQGLLSRLLVVAPESLAGRRPWREPDPRSRTALNRYEARLAALLRRQPRFKQGGGNALDPRVIDVSAEARAAWIAFFNLIERQLGADGSLHPVKGLAAKLAEHAARLAAVIALVEDIEAPAIELRHIEAGIALAEHYASEALRLHGMAQILAPLKLAKQLLKWLRETWDEDVISPIEVYQSGPNPIRDAARAREIMAILVEHGYLKALDKAFKVKTKKRREVYRIIRAMPA
jgi:hypothetical protein